MNIVGWLCLGFGFGVIAAGGPWWGAGYKTGYRDGVDDTNAMICGGGDVTSS